MGEFGSETAGMSMLVVDIERVILDAAAGEVHDAQRLGPLIERALARWLEQENSRADLTRASRDALASSASFGSRAGDEEFADHVARAILRALRQ
jgi:hypothetical protein